MPRFNLELLPETPESMDELKQRAAHLSERLGTLEGPMCRPYSLPDIEEPCSWAILQYIEGTELPEQAREEVVRFTENRLSDPIIQEAFTMAVNGAMLHRRDGSPGYKHGHRIIWEQIAANPKSMFYEAITPEFHKRLNNGRFWEELGNLNCVNNGRSYSDVENVLVFHNSDLDLSFVPRGIGIHEENGGSINLQWHYNKRISERGLVQYRNFMERIDSKLGDLQIDRQRFEPLVKAYLEAVVEDDIPTGHYLTLENELAENPWLRKYDHLVSERMRV